jgi:hypothetical protein
MSNIKSAGRLISAIFLAFLSTLASFGLILSFLWFLGSDEKSYRLITSIISASLAIVLGGFILVWVAKSKNLMLPALFGFLFGALSFTYLLGIDFLVVPLTIVSGLLAAAGGLLSRLLSQRKTALNLDPG